MKETRENKNLQFEVAQDRRLARAISNSSRFVRMLVTAPSSDGTVKRPPIKISFVMDRSGSMDGEKIRQAKLAVEEGVQLLADRDEFALVTFNDQAAVPLPMRAKPESGRGLSSSLGEVGASGQTNLCDGYLRGAEEFGSSIGDAIQRIILVSDGQANVGETSQAVLQTHATELRRRGVSTATLGIGEDFNESLLGAMANGGGGVARWAERPHQVRKAIRDCIEETLETVLTRVRIHVRLPHAEFQLLSLGDLSGGDGECTIDLGDMVADQEREVLLRVILPRGEIGSSVSAIIKLEAETLSGSSLTHRNDATWTYAQGQAIDAELNDLKRDRTIDLAVARHYAEIAKGEATDLNRRGSYNEARRVLERAAERIERYALTPELKAIVRELRSEAKKWSQPRDERTRKEAYFAMLNVRGSRFDDGSPRRRGQ